MARPLRIEYSGAFYHVINRGNGGQAIFKSKRDREKFLFYMENMAERYGVRIHCYCMMNNHYHLLVETPEANLSRSIQWLNVSYAMYFNVKRGRHGHLFQGRFKSILVEADEYFKHLSRYIHLNPIRANMAEQLIDYPWSSYRVFVGKQKAPVWLETDWILKWFGKKRKAAQREYRGFVESIDIENMENPSSNIVGGLVLGSPEFVDWVKQTFLQSREDDCEISGLRNLKPRATVDEVLERVSAYFKLEVDQIVCKGKKKNWVRDIAIYIARETTGKSVARIGDYFGRIKGQSVTMRHKRVEGAMQNDKRLRKDIKRLMNNE